MLCGLNNLITEKWNVSQKQYEKNKGIEKENKEGKRKEEK